MWSEQARRARRAARGNGPGKLDTAPPGRPNHDPVSVGADAPVEPQAAVPVSPLADRVLHGFGWLADRQLPHGTVIWTAPSGQVYTTKPGGNTTPPASPVNNCSSLNASPEATNQHSSELERAPSKRSKVAERELVWVLGSAGP